MKGNRTNHPRKAPEENHAKKISISVCEEEDRLIRSRAEAAGKTVTRYLLDLVLEDRQKEKCPVDKAVGTPKVCEDAISRTQAIDMLRRAWQYRDGDTAMQLSIDGLKGLPSVNLATAPHENDEKRTKEEIKKLLDKKKFGNVRFYSDDVLKNFLREIFFKGVQEGYDLAKFRLELLDGFPLTLCDDFFAQKIDEFREILDLCREYEETTESIHK